MSRGKRASHGLFRDMQEELRSLFKEPRAMAVLLPLLAFWALVQLWNLPIGENSRASCDLRNREDSNAFENKVYNLLMGYRFPQSTAQEVALVTISEDTTPPGVLTNTCKARELIAQLIEQLIPFDPGVIAVDLSYSDRSCPDESSNNLLRGAVEQAKMPIVVGLSMQSS